MASTLGTRRLSGKTVAALTAAGYFIVGTAAEQGLNGSLLRIARVEGGWVVAYRSIRVVCKTLADAIKHGAALIEAENSIVAEVAKFKQAEVCNSCGYLADSIGHKNSH